MILVSACLLGIDCKYNGENNFKEELLNFLKDKDYILVCPEQLGGLPTPRNPSEITGGDGRDVLDGACRVKDNKGFDVTKPFIKGAEETLKIAQLYKARAAILKKRSPSCGSIDIYNGNFQYKTKKGKGVTAALLEENGIIIGNEDNYKRLSID